MKFENVVPSVLNMEVLFLGGGDMWRFLERIRIRVLESSFEILKNLKFSQFNIGLL